MINLVIDIGNSRTKIALFNEHDLMFNVPIDHLTVKHVKMLKDEHPQLNRVILSSVKPDDMELKQVLQEEFDQFIELDHRTKLPIENLYQTPQTLGKDRLAAAVGANELFPDQNLLVIDAGTAITYDLVSEKNQFIGGNISPGLEMRFKALNHYTGKLPLVSYSDHFEPIGRNTTEAIRAGVQNGILYEMAQNIDFFNRNYQNLHIIMTGGDSNFFDKKLNYSIFVHFNLTLIGLNRILEYNAKNK
ncbi:MAG TPA: type III pantothenate kinase [Prolixibacteraceae bacterium]|nr:type III pantothenate kinase [Prolixibacteraceae bacterium]